MRVSLLLLLVCASVLAASARRVVEHPRSVHNRRTKRAEALAGFPEEVVPVPASARANKGVVASTYVEFASKIANGLDGLPANTLNPYDLLGVGLDALGDVDGDGNADVAVGAYSDDAAGDAAGSVFIFLLSNDTTVVEAHKMTTGLRGFEETLEAGDLFGFAVAGPGDIDGDGVPDMVVSAPQDHTADASDVGAVYVIRLRANATAKATTKIANGLGGLPANTLGNADQFGYAVGGAGDINADGVPDIVVGAVGDDETGYPKGAVYVCFLASSGDLASFVKLTPANARAVVSLFDEFGSDVAGIDDVNNDGVPDIAVGAHFANRGASDTGTVHVLLLFANGSVSSAYELNQVGFDYALTASSELSSVHLAGDVDDDGVNDLVLGAYKRDTVFLALMNADGTVREYEAITASQVGGSAGVYFGERVTSVPHGRGRALLVGAGLDDVGGTNTGSVFVVNLVDPTPSASVTPSSSPSASVTPSSSPTASVTPSSSPTASVTSSVTPTPSPTPSASATGSSTTSATASTTASTTASATTSPSSSPSQSRAPSSSPSSSVSPSTSPTSTSSSSVTPSESASGSASPTPTVSAPPSASSAPSLSASLSASRAPSPSATASSSRTPSNTAVPSSSPSSSRAPSRSRVPSRTPSTSPGSNDDGGDSLLDSPAVIVGGAVGGILGGLALALVVQRVCLTPKRVGTHQNALEVELGSLHQEHDIPANLAGLDDD